MQAQTGVPNQQGCLKGNIERLRHIKIVLISRLSVKAGMVLPRARWGTIQITSYVMFNRYRLV
jgi:hypothetical protein